MQWTNPPCTRIQAAQLIGTVMLVESHGTSENTPGLPPMLIGEYEKMAAFVVDEFTDSLVGSSISMPHLGQANQTV